MTVACSVEDQLKVLDRVHRLCRHIENVQRGCRIIGEKLIRQGEFRLGIELIAAGMAHDQSKFFGAEWQHLTNGITDQDAFRCALHQHHLNNPHHPEHHGGIHHMPDVNLYECVVDWWSRSIELGEDVREWIFDKAATKFGFVAEDDPIRQRISLALDLLLEDSL